MVWIPARHIVRATRRQSRVALGALSVVAFALVWELATRVSNLPGFILPKPVDVLSRFSRAVADGSLAANSAVTLSEVLGGLLLGSALAMTFGYLIAKSDFLDSLFSPVVVAIQAVPIVVITPLLIIWFGPQMLSKVLIAALIVFFPVLMTTKIGIRSVPRPFYDSMHTLHATPLQILLKLEIPAALPALLGGLRIGTTLAVVGAIVGEFVGSNRGLGFLVNIGRGQYDTAMVFVAVFTLIAIALLLQGTVVWLERRLLFWQG